MCCVILLWHSLSLPCNYFVYWESCLGRIGLVLGWHLGGKFVFVSVYLVLLYRFFGGLRLF